VGKTWDKRTKGRKRGSGEGKEGRREKEGGKEDGKGVRQWSPLIFQNTVSPLTLTLSLYYLTRLKPHKTAYIEVNRL